MRRWPGTVDDPKLSSSLYSYILFNGQFHNCQWRSFITVHGQFQSNRLRLYCQLTIWPRIYRRRHTLSVCDKPNHKIKENMPHGEEFEKLWNYPLNKQVKFLYNIHHIHTSVYLADICVGKIALSVFLKLLTSGNKRYHITDASSAWTITQTS